MKLAKNSAVKTFMRSKSVEALTGRDHVFNRRAKTGLPANTMFHYTDAGMPTLYYSEDKAQTTFISLGEEVFTEIDKSTTTVRDNFNIKNNIINSLITANSIIESEFSGKRLPIHSDLMLLKVYESEPGIDWRYFDLSATSNPIYQYIHSGVRHSSVEKWKSLSLEDLAELTADADALPDAEAFEWFNVVCIAKAGAKSVEDSGEIESTSECSLDKGASGEDDSESEEETDAVLEQLDGVISSEHAEEDKSVFFDTQAGIITGNKKRYEKCKQLANQLASKLKGVYGKENTMTPQKKLNIRNYVRGSQSMFKRKRDTSSGKKMSINLIIDCSGSMSGRYITNAASICMIFNMIAREHKTITGSIILSAGEGSVSFDIANAPETLIDRMHAFSGAEGIARTINREMDKLQKAKFNVCITDCQLTDEPINKKSYESKNIMLEGIYIGKMSKNKKDHEEHMDQFFSRSKIIDTVEETIEYFVNTIF